MQKKNVVVIGGGFGGLTLVQSLAKAPVNITLIDRSNHHLFQPLLYQVAIGALSPGDIATPLRYVLQNQLNVDIKLAEVTEVDRSSKRITLDSGEQLPYDQLVVAVGNAPTYYGNDDWQRNAPGLKELTDALRIRERLFMTFERASQLRLPEERKPLLTFVVVGGGPTGVEVAGALAELVTYTLRGDFRNFGPDEISIILIEGGDGVLAGFDPALREAAQRDLEKMGIQVRLNTRVERISSTEIVAGGVIYPTTNVIWAAGNQASPLLNQLGAPQDRTGRVVVATDLALPDDADVFVIGDAAHALDRQGKPLPGIAPVAMQQGRYLASIIRHNAARSQRKPFAYFDKGTMATIGRASAVVQVGKIKLTGFVAWMMWAVVHIFFLINFRNRLRVIVEWLWFYVTFRPGARLIYRKRRLSGSEATQVQVQHERQATPTT